VTNNAPGAFPIGVTTVTWTVTDNSGNTATCTQNVTVTDNVNPTISCPAAWPPPPTAVAPPPAWPWVRL
jgi:carbohydrate-binding DOMON domain-containing protein